jgi:hypothetical protein
MDFTSQQVNELVAAQTPEEAYKIFALSASQLIQDSIAIALAKAIADVKALADTNPQVVGWDGYINGLTLTGCWGTPGIKSPVTQKNLFSSDLGPDNFLGGTIRISGEWSC